MAPSRAGQYQNSLQTIYVSHSLHDNITKYRNIKDH